MMWVTDMAMMPNIHKIVLAFTDGTLGEHDCLEYSMCVAVT